MIEYPPDFLSYDEIMRVRPWIEGALEYALNTHNYADVIAEIEVNTATMWPFEHSAVVTQIATFPKVRIFNFWLAGGDMEDLLSHEPGMIEWAKAEGCTRFHLLGRPGWSRAMKHLGYRPAIYIAAKEG